MGTVLFPSDLNVTVVVNGTEMVANVTATVELSSLSVLDAQLDNNIASLTIPAGFASADIGVGTVDGKDKSSFSWVTSSAAVSFQLWSVPRRRGGDPNSTSSGLGWLLWLIIILGIALVLFFVLGAFGFFKRKKPPTDSEIEAAKAEADMEMDGIDSDEILDGGDDGGGAEVAEL